MRFILYFILLRWFFRIALSAVTDPIETLIVNIEGDFSNLLKDADEGVDKTKDKLGELDDAGQKAGKGTSTGAAKMGAAFGLAAGVAGKLLDVIVNIATSAVQMFKGMVTQAVSLAGSFEQVQLTFTNIFQDRGQANAFLKGLQGEAAKLGVSFNEASQFAKSLFPDTKNVEEFNDLLRVAAVGAADAGLPLQELIFSFNEAVSGDFTSIRDRLDIPRDVIERIKESPDTVAALTEELDKLFTKRGVNDLEAAGSTLEGLQRRVKGFGEELLLVAGLEILGPLREGFQNFFDILQANRPTLEEISAGIGEIIGVIVDFARENVFGSFDMAGPVESVKTFIDWLERVVRSLLAATKQVGGFIAALKPVGILILNLAKVAFGPLLNALSQGAGLLSRFDEAMVTAAKGTAIITAVISGLTETVKGVMVALGGMGKALGSLLTGNLEGFKAGLTQANTGIAQLTEGGAAAFKKSMLESATAIDAMVNPLEEATEGVEGLGKAMEEIPEETVEEAAVPLLDQGKLDAFSNQLIGATENRAKEQEKLEADHAQKTLDIINDANDKALDIEKTYTDDLADLTEESEKKRLDIIEGTRSDLAKLADETDRDLKDKQKEFNDDEQRETEDHLKEMRRMQEDHLLDLEDAVRSRDAGAIVDLQRKFATESSRKEEDFSTGQSREKSDFGDELNQIRESESQKRNELLAKQSEQLDDLRQHEEEKRAEIEMKRLEENEKLQQNLTDRLQKENDSFIQRQASLDEALQKQLAAIAKSLADEKEVTEEGAREILETFDEYFGIGGNIDELMDDFSRRRKIRADITVAFQGDSGETESKTPSEALSSGGSFGGRKRLGGVQEFAEGGTLVADKPTLALFGEAGPEVVQFTPMSQLSSPGGGEPGRMVIEMTGSAPPGIGSGERDQIAAVLLTALQDSGALN